MGIANAVKQSAWMKLALTAFMTLIWLSTHFIAGHQTSLKLNELTNSRTIQLFTVDLFNYFAIACSLAITAVTRISFLVKTIVIIIVILLQVIMNITILSDILKIRLMSLQRGFVSTATGSAIRLISNFEGAPYLGSGSNNNQAATNSNEQVFSNQNNSSLEDAQAIPSSTNNPVPLINLNGYHFDQWIFTLTLVTICWALFLINRQFELTNRRLFLWRKQVEVRKEKVADMRQKNEALVYNILPPNVAKIFLGKRTINDEELYSKSYDAVGVLFAAMPNFSDFYSEESVNNQGLECLRFLNEVISDYDALLDQDRFKNIIKIKTMGSTYMAASGLYEGDALEEAKALTRARKVSHQQLVRGSNNNNDNDNSANSQDCSTNNSNAKLVPSEAEIRSKWGHLEQLTEFALALKETLDGINKESFNNFVLRIGKRSFSSYATKTTTALFVVVTSNCCTINKFVELQRKEARAEFPHF